MSIGAMQKMRNEHFQTWKLIQSAKKSPYQTVVVNQAKRDGFKIDDSFKNTLNEKEMYDHDGKIKLHANKNALNVHLSRKKLIVLVSMSLLFIIWGIVVLTETITYLNESISHCSHITEEQLLQQNPRN